MAIEDIINEVIVSNERDVVIPISLDKLGVQIKLRKN